MKESFKIREREKKKDIRLCSVVVLRDEWVVRTLGCDRDREKAYLYTLHGRLVIDGIYCVGKRKRIIRE